MLRKLALAAVVLVAGAVTLLVPTMLSSPAAGAGFALSSALAGAPRGLVAVALQAGRATQQDPNVLLAIARVETDWGQAQRGLPDDLVPADLQAPHRRGRAPAGRGDRGRARAGRRAPDRRLGQPAAGRRRPGARHGLHAVPALDLAR